MANYGQLYFCVQKYKKIGWKLREKPSSIFFILNMCNMCQGFCTFAKFFFVKRKKIVILYPYFSKCL